MLAPSATLTMAMQDESEGSRRARRLNRISSGIRGGGGGPLPTLGEGEIANDPHLLLGSLVDAPSPHALSPPSTSQRTGDHPDPSSQRTGDHPGQGHPNSECFSRQSQSPRIKVRRPRRVTKMQRGAGELYLFSSSDIVVRCSLVITHWRHCALKPAEMR